jgi:hypothetical protein
VTQFGVSGFVIVTDRTRRARKTHIARARQLLRSPAAGRSPPNPWEIDMKLSFHWAATVAALLLATPALGHDPYRVDLVPCTEALCEVMGSAPLHEGRVEVDDDGEVEVELAGGPAAAVLCVKFQPSVGEMRVIGDLETDALGQAEATVGEFETGVFMGLFRLHDGSCETEGAPLFVTAFAVRAAHDDDGLDDLFEDGQHGENDNDGDGIPNDEDPDDDNDGIDDVDDPDDDNDGIPDTEDADPDDANPFDDDAVDEAKSAYKAERKTLKIEVKAEIRELKDQHKLDVEGLKEDLKDRLDD